MLQSLMRTTEVYDELVRRCKDQKHVMVVPAFELDMDLFNLPQTTQYRPPTHAPEIEAQPEASPASDADGPTSRPTRKWSAPATSSVAMDGGDAETGGAGRVADAGGSARLEASGCGCMERSDEKYNAHRAAALHVLQVPHRTSSPSSCCKMNSFTIWVENKMPG